jgi:hypothetical protein
MPGFGGDVGGTPPGNPHQVSGLAPFSLMTPHQVSSQQVEALNAAALGGIRTYFTGYTWTTDHHTPYQVAF